VSRGQGSHAAALAGDQRASRGSLLQFLGSHELRPSVRALWQYAKDPLGADDRSQLAAQRAVDGRHRQHTPGGEVGRCAMHESRHVVDVLDHFGQQQDVEGLGGVLRGVGLTVPAFERLDRRPFSLAMYGERTA